MLTWYFASSVRKGTSLIKRRAAADQLLVGRIEKVRSVAPRCMLENSNGSSRVGVGSVPFQDSKRLARPRRYPRIERFAGTKCLQIRRQILTQTPHVLPLQPRVALRHGQLSTPRAVRTPVTMTPNSAAARRRL